RADRMRDDRPRRRDADDRRDRREDDAKPFDLPQVRFADAYDGERHVLRFHGRGPRAPLWIHSTPQEAEQFLDEWHNDLRTKATEQEKGKQQGYVDAARTEYEEARRIQASIPKETRSDDEEREKRRLRYALEAQMRKFAHQARNRLYFDLPEADYGVFQDLTLGREQPRPKEDRTATFLSTRSKTVAGGPGQDAGEAAHGQPPGWLDIRNKGLSKGSRWVRMHLLPERIGGKASGNNLVPARGPEMNIKFLHGIEEEAYGAIKGTETVIHYETAAEFQHKESPHVPSRIQAKYTVYERAPGAKGTVPGDWTPNGMSKPFGLPHDPVADNEETLLSINHAGRPTINLRLLNGKHEGLAKDFVTARDELQANGGILAGRGDFHRLVNRNLNTSRAGIDLLRRNLRRLDRKGEINWN
ncbi:hypothetical protein, partial [Streptomyces sp. UH6]|uniref:hypothetical protein n=1 Tax=Streptomyces sp. UH6 TaxID=2748379 RepID=UPI0015D4F248